MLGGKLAAERTSRNCKAPLRDRGVAMNSAPVDHIRLNAQREPAPRPSARRIITRRQQTHAPPSLRMTHPRSTTCLTLDSASVESRCRRSIFPIPRQSRIWQLFTTLAAFTAMLPPARPVGYWRPRLRHVGRSRVACPRCSHHLCIQCNKYSPGADDRPIHFAVQMDGWCASRTTLVYFA